MAITLNGSGTVSDVTSFNTNSTQRVAIDATTGATTFTANVQLSGVGARILADFSNATIPSRTMFQTSVANQATTVFAIPNGTGNYSQWVATNASDPNNCGLITSYIDTGVALVGPTIRGTGAYVPLQLTVGGSPRIHIGTDGKVGIGTTSPGWSLDVVGGILAAAGFPAVAGGNNVGFSFRGDGDTGMFSPSNGELRFFCNNTERLAIAASSGRAFFNTTTWGDWGSAPIVIQNNNSDNTGLSFHTPQRSTAAIFKFYGPLVQFECRNSTDGGFIPILASAFTVGSDYRLKENVRPLAGSLARVLQLNPCTYTLKKEKTDAEGFLAHELQAVVPYAVTGEKDAALEDGTPLYQGVDLSKLVPLLVSAVQELTQQNKELADRVAALEAKLA